MLFSMRSSAEIASRAASRSDLSAAFWAFDIIAAF
jgi:lipid-A-disaccharide synthase-like uncharacterized protein